MPRPINCSFTPQEPPAFTKVDPPTSPPNGVRVQMELVKRLGLVSEFDWSKFTRSVDAQEKLSDLVNRNYFETLMAKKVHIKPGSQKNFQQWLSRHFPSFASGNDSAKQVRNFLADAKRAGENLWDVMPFYASQADELLAKLGSADVIDDAYKQFKNTLKVNGVDLNRDTLGRLWVKAIEVGQTDRILRMTDAGDNGKRLLQHRFDKFIDELGGLGIGENGANALLAIVKPVSQAYDDLLVVARNSGVDVSAIENIGYINRIFSADAKFRMGREQADLYGGFLESQTKGLGVAFQKSRSTYDFVVEDELVLAAAMGLVDTSPKKLQNTVRLKRKTLDRVADVRDNALPRAISDRERILAELAEYDNNIKLAKDGLKEAQPNEVSRLTNELKSMQRVRDELAKEQRKLTTRISKWEKEVADLETTGKELLDAKQELDRVITQATEGLNGVLTNEKKLLTELANLPDSTLDALVDSGVLSKLPMMTEDLYEHMVKRYKMPYKGLEELMITDPRRAYQAATDQLRQLMGKSVMSQAMFKDAVEYGWGITGATKANDPAQYGKFVKLSPEVYRRFGIESLPGAEEVFLHPMVADMYTSILEVSTDPGSLSTFASVWQYVNRIFKKQALATTGFVGRQLFQVFVSSAMAGTNMANLIPGIYDYIRFKRVGIDIFDNTKKVYAGGKFTEREMMVELFKRGAIDNTHHTTPIAGQVSQVASESYGAWNPMNAGRALGYWSSIITGRGLFPRIKDGKLGWDAIEYGAGLFERMTDEASGVLMAIGTNIENAAKLAHYRSTLRDGAANAVGQYITNGKRFHFTDVDAAVKHARDYFFDYSDMGVGDKFISKNIIPFWSYMSRNMPAVVRHVLRNPTQYMAYQRIYALMNQEVREAGEDAPEGGFMPWQKGFGRIYVPHPNGKPNEWLHIPFTPFDPVADAINGFEEGAKGLGQMFGLFPGSYKDDIAQVSPTNHTIPFLDTVVEQGYGSIKALYGLISKKDPGTGQSLIQDETKTTSLLGVEIPGNKAPLIKFLIENTLPSVSNLNRFNPGGVFGIKEQEDGFGNTTRKAKPSWTGAARSDSDTNKDGLTSDPLVFAARSLGLTINSVDTVKNMGYTETELSMAVKDMKTYTKKLEKRLGELEPGTGEYQKIADSIVTTKAIAAEIELGRAKTETWLNSRGAQTSTQRRKLEKEQEKLKAWLEVFGK